MAKKINIVIEKKENNKMREGSLASLIVNEANRYFAEAYTKNLKHKVDGKQVRWKEDEWNNAKRHHDICVELVRLATEHNFPYSALVYFAVGKDAHRKFVFDRGYETINVAKAETILKWLKKFAEYNRNPSFYTSDKIVHAFCKFYQEVSTKDKDFNRGMKAFTKLPSDTFKPSKWKTMREFYDLFFKPFITCVEVDENNNTVNVTVTENPLCNDNEG